MTNFQTKNLHCSSAGSVSKRLSVFPLEWDKICMLEPVYLPDDINGCRVYYDNGTTDDLCCRVNMVLDAWAEHELTSVDLARKLSSTWLGSEVKNRFPLPFRPDLCLMPVKCRRRQRHNDCASGYLVLNKVRHVAVKTGGGSYIRFAGNPYPVPVLESRRSILENLTHGRIVAEAYRSSRVHLLASAEAILL